MLLNEYLKHTFHISDHILDDIGYHTHQKEYPKGSIILEPESYTKNVYFVESGIVKMYYFKGGKEITHYFFSENKFVAGAESVFYDKKSSYGIKVLEHATISKIAFPYIQQLARSDVQMSQLIQAILSDALVSFSNRLQSLQFETAQERYANFLENNPDILLRAPLGDIASYLGISQQTLSVIRGNTK